MTSQENEKRQYRPEDYCREDEISLIDLLLVIWKWKWLIIAGVVICVVAAAVISSRMQRIYEVSMAIEPGIAGVGQSGNFLTIDSPNNISGKIEGGVYNKKLQEYFHLNLQKHKLEFKSNPIKGASLIKITSRWEEGDVSIGMKISGQLLEFLGDDYSKVIKQMMDNYEQQIKINMDRIENFQNELQLHQAMYMNIQQRKKRIVEEIRNVNKNMNKIVNKIDSFENPDDSFSVVLHAMTIQQNLVYSQLNNQLYDLESREKDIEAMSAGLKKSISDVMSKMNELQFKKGLISNIKVVQQPEVSPNPVAPKKKQIILLAGMASLLIFIFLAFFIEYIRNARCPAGMK